MKTNSYKIVYIHLPDFRTCLLICTEQTPLFKQSKVKKNNVKITQSSLPVIKATEKGIFCFLLFFSTMLIKWFLWKIIQRLLSTKHQCFSNKMEKTEQKDEDNFFYFFFLLIQLLLPVGWQPFHLTSILSLRKCIALLQPKALTMKDNWAIYIYNWAPSAQQGSG